MGQENFTYLALLLLIFAAGLKVREIIEARSKRTDYLKKFKPNTIQYQSIEKLLNPILLPLVLTGMLLSVVLLAADVYVHAHYGDFLLMLLFVIVVIALGFALIPRFLRLGSSSAKRQ